jgi:hypothetical protein
MNCAKDSCMTTETCKCYALLSENNPRHKQMCGYRRGDSIFMCDASCCDGGCPGQCSGVSPREPYGIVDKYSSTEVDNRQILLWIGIILCILTLASTLALF